MILTAMINPIDKITDRLYIGNYSSATMLDYGNREGITHILNCTPDAHQGLQNFEVCQIAVNDGHELPPDAIRTALRFIAQALHNNGKVLVHCHAGISRSASIVCAHLMKAGFSWDEALDLVRIHRPQVYPHPLVSLSIKKFFNQYLGPQTTMLEIE